LNTRSEVAREAARLLYTGAYEEYKDAKTTAAASLGAKAVPTNHEVAEELDRIAEEAEGPDRLRRLAEMRTTALKVMRLLADMRPTLIGSVWRGTARRGSDIDVVVYGDPRDVEARVTPAYPVAERTNRTFNVGGSARSSTHLTLEAGPNKVELVVRPPGDAEAYRDERCDIYGDPKRGLGLRELERLMRADPLRRFVPRRRRR
jgi:hypothetical protein